MADDAVVHIGENSPEYVAMLLLREIAYSENIETFGGAGGGEKSNREWLLRTYAQCLRIVQMPHTVDEMIKQYSG